MQALVFRGIGNIRLEEVDKPQIQQDYDAIVKVVTSAICGTDLHFIRGTMGPMNPNTILGHEAVGIVEKVGRGVKNFKAGDRVIVPSTVACGYCEMCHQGFYSQCNKANPNGPDAGTAFFGGPSSTGPLQGCQAEYVRVPFANHNLVTIPENVSDSQAILLSDIFPTAYFSADIAQVKTGNVIVVLGCGPVGQFVIASCKLLGVTRIIAIDTVPSRLEMARKQGAECIDFNKESPLTVIKDLTNGALADVVIDAVGIDAYAPHKGPGEEEASRRKNEFQEEVVKLVPAIKNDGQNWIPGNAPSYSLREGVELAKKCGTISIIGVYPPTFMIYPIGKAMNKNLKIVMGNCPHRAYIPKLLTMVQAGLIDPCEILTQQEPLQNIVEAYKNFDLRTEGWVKVALQT
ncbi:alcohol dehydrogenase catalytic domain-containing protein [Legionella cardiaca]|uniref:Alcohol dehydrogenase catalytic domain-containing protein n=1 Tax=Legionella cardiaca TaxID=1071983 RepID=A0ABY8AX40_9GAMM|nr:alcohol dehydrogenase catalytic domain-containing protein [Legionella cardiaca]WED44001.1 alcohol dehydrogenase catalytic domain-containing protein [Legionella cardiaca]